MGDTVQVYQTYNGPCPYLKVGEWENLSFNVDSLNNAVFEHLLNQGFRRSGRTLYHPICKSCQQCIPIRLNLRQFQITKSQRRCLKNNLDVVIEHGPLEFSPEVFELYRKYQDQWHESDEEPSRREFEHFLMTSPVSTEMMYYRLDQQLIGVGWVDVLDTLISSVYFIFNPDFSKRRLGVFSILKEIEFALKIGLEWMYLGYWVQGSSKMNYKADYKPCEILVNQQWQRLEQQ